MIVFQKKNSIERIDKEDLWSTKILEYDIPIYKPNEDLTKIKEKRNANNIRVTGLPADCTANDLIQLTHRCKGKACIIHTRKLRKSNQEIASFAIIQTDYEINKDNILPTSVNIGEHQLFLLPPSTKYCFKCGNNEHESTDCRAPIKYLRNFFSEQIKNKNKQKEPEENGNPTAKNAEEQLKSTESRNLTNKYNSFLNAYIRNIKLSSMNTQPPLTSGHNSRRQSFAHNNTPLSILKRPNHTPNQPRHNEPTYNSTPPNNEIKELISVIRDLKKTVESQGSTIIDLNKQIHSLTNNQNDLKT
jgi:hypothetical protein